MALIATDALMYFAPLEAIAETCEADNSILNMNMPLLLFVALIGATVGGKLPLLLFVADSSFIVHLITC